MFTCFWSKHLCAWCFSNSIVGALGSKLCHFQLAKLYDLHESSRCTLLLGLRMPPNPSVIRKHFASRMQCSVQIAFRATSLILSLLFIAPCCQSDWIADANGWQEPACTFSISVCSDKTVDRVRLQAANGFESSDLVVDLCAVCKWGGTVNANRFPNLRIQSNNYR